MKHDFQDCILNLLPSQVVRLHEALGVTIRCNNGIVWVTQEGCARDDFLCAGTSLCIAADGLTLVEAIGDKAASLTLRARHAFGHVLSAVPAEVTIQVPVNLSRTSHLCEIPSVPQTCRFESDCS